MIDLTKLAAEDLMDVFRASAFGVNEWAEIRRRLERLETAESTAQAVQNELALTQEFLREAKERLEQCEALCEYAQHKPHCASTDCGGCECTCGYDAARAALEE